MCQHRGMPKQRADLALVARGLAPSRSRAQALILAGKVMCGTERVDKAGQQVSDDEVLCVSGPDHPFVSRGGVKLAGALEALQYDVLGKVAADFGASTGGFTDCLLQKGATRVYAIDVGYGQLHNKLRQDDRVVVMERTNARHLKQSDLPERVSLVVIDASFIGVEKLLPAAVEILDDDGDILAMIKPQFQVGKDQVGKGGVVRDSQMRQLAVRNVIEAATTFGLVDEACVDAPITGPKGNQETFVWFRTRPTRRRDR